MILYHYATPGLWKHISEGIGEQAYKGLVPKSSPTNHVDSANGIFALTDPMPKSWMLNKLYPDAWTHLISLEAGIGRLLLDVEVRPSDDIMVYDFGYKLSALKYRRRYNIYDAWVMEEAEGRYLANGLSLSAYLVRKAKGIDFSLPEVIIANPVPLERLSISKDQPLLDEVIEGRVRYRYRINEQLDDRQELLRQMQAVPELEQWTSRCREVISQYLRPASKERF